MKKLRKILIGLMAIALAVPYFSVSANSASFKPATLYNESNRVAVYSENEADYYFGAGYKLETQPPIQNLGIAIPNIVANFETSLALSLSSTATSSMTLVSGTTDDATTLSGLYGFVIDAGASNQEYVLATCSNTACSALTRGISVITGSSSIAALQSSHRRGATVKITDHPIIATLSHILGGTETTPGGLTFGTNTITGINDLAMNGALTGITQTPLSSATTSAANVDYVNNSVVAGAVAGTENVPGIWQGATQDQMSAGVATSSYSGTDYNLVLQSKYASSTSSATTTIPITNTSGKLDTSFIEQTAEYTWSGGLLAYGDGSDGDVIISATTTLTSDKYYDDLTINAGVTLYPNGYKVFVLGTLTVNGTLSADGNSGTNASSSPDISGSGYCDSTINGGVGGAAISTSTYKISVNLAGKSGAVGGKSSIKDSNGSAATAYNGFIPTTGGLPGVSGGIGGSGDAPGASNAGARATTTLIKYWGSMPELANTIYTASLVYTVDNGGSAGGSYGDSTTLSTLSTCGGGGGGNGASGGTLFIFARKIVISATGSITANGGNAGNGGNSGNRAGSPTYNLNYCATGGGGGGGIGGNGGYIMFLYYSLSNSGSITVNGGTKGLKGIAGTSSCTGGIPNYSGADGNDGLDGNSGIVRYYNIAY